MKKIILFISILLLLSCSTKHAELESDPTYIIAKKVIESQKASNVTLVLDNSDERL